jgi:pilus assembly protein CpaB
MNRRKLFLIGFLALIVAGMLTVVAYRSSVGKLATIRANSTTVVVATKDLGLGQRVGTDDIRLAEFAAANVPEGAFRDPKELVGRGVIAAISKNEILLPNKIAALNAGVGLPAMIPPDMRAVSVKVNDVVGVAGFVGPGTRVDVLVTGSPSNNTQDTVTTTVLENVEVLAAGQKIQPNAEGKPENVPVITLLVTPADAQTLTLASTEGKIQLSLRSPIDAKKPNTTPVHKTTLYRVAAPELAERPRKVLVAKKKTEAPPAPRSVEVFRGIKVETAKF